MHLLYSIRRLLPFWMVLVAFAMGHAPIVWALVLGGASLVSLVVPRPEKLSTFGELVTCLLVLVVPIMWSKGQEDLNPAISFSLIVLCTFVTRSFLQEPLLGAAVDRLLILGAAVAIGLGLKSSAYPLLIALCSFTLFGRFKPEATRRPIERTTWFALGLAALSLGAMLLFIPWLNNATNRRFSHYLQGRSSQTGFSPSVRLDGSGSIETSDAIALRIYAQNDADIDTLDYLRGAALDRFDGTSWTASSASVRDGETVQEAIMESPATAFAEVHATRRAPYVFAPLGQSVWGAHRLTVDGFGVWRAGGLGIDHWGLLGLRTQAAGPGAPVAPRASDLEVPAALIPQLHALALEWTEGATTDEERMARITSKLRQFEYTLDRGKDMKRKRSPLLDFLLVSERGHCEFFATALITLGRTLGIPGRMVTGYRVVERNGYGHYAVVRARHAHAWAEVHLGGQWRTLDATPAVVSLTPRESKSVRSLLDYLVVHAQRAYDSAMARPERTLPVLAGMVLVGLLVRRALLRRRGSVADSGDETPEAFIAFSNQLAALGFKRAPGETLFALAARLTAANHESHAERLLRYAEARYNPKQPQDAWQRALAETTTK